MHGGNATTNYLVLDIEGPSDIHPRHFWAHNDSRLEEIVKAYKLRIKIVREFLPNAKLALYATTSPDFDPNATAAKRVNGYQCAANLGLFDQIDFLVPVLYLAPTWNA